MFGLVPFKFNNGENNRGLSINDMFNDFFNDDMLSEFKSCGSFKIDIKETPEEYVVHAELPGVNKEDINIILSKAYINLGKYIEAIEYLESSGAITALPEELREAAELRRTFSQASLGELAGCCRPPITKSGMKHRLERLIKAADDARNSSAIDTSNENIGTDSQ